MTLHRVTSQRSVAIAALVAVVAVAAAVAWLVFGRDEGGTLAPQGNVYVEGVAGTWEQINPLYAQPNPVDEALSRLVFSGLTRLGPDGAVLPDMADNWDVTSDGCTYTFRLKRGLRWHDGEPVTSADVAFTIRHVQDSAFAGSGNLVNAWTGVGVETPDELTVVFLLEAPFAPFLARNTMLGILPEHLLRDLTPAELARSTFNSQPVGSGPYRLTSINSEQAILVANGNYHFGEPPIGTLRMRFFQDPAAAAAALVAGDLNGLVAESGNGDRVEQLGAVDGAVVEPAVGGAYLVLYLNNARLPFDEVRVRRAISLAIDREAALAEGYGATALGSSAVIPPGSWAYVSQYDDVGRDLDSARALLEEAGWVENATTTILTKDGVELRFTIRTDNDPRHVAVANAIAAQLEDVGIRASVASTSFGVLQRDFLAQRAYDAALAIWDQGPDPDPYSGWHSSENGTAGLNFANFADIVVDELISQARTSPDLEVRRENYRQFQEVWQQLMPSVVVGYPQLVYVHAAQLDTGGLGLLYAAADRFANVVRWRLGG